MKVFRYLILGVFIALRLNATITSTADVYGPQIPSSTTATLTSGIAFQQGSDLLVVDVGQSGSYIYPAVVLKQGSDYVVTGGGYNSANVMQVGNVILTGTGSHTPASGDSIYILRNTPANQLTSLANAGYLSAAMIEQALDKQATLSQMAFNTGNASLRVESWETANATPPALVMTKNARSGNLLGFDANGNVAFYTTNVNNVAGVTSISTGAGISTNNSAGSVLLTNTGVLSLSAGTGISLSGSTGAITVSATGGGGTGTVTSVGLSMPSGFTVANSPVTSSGTIAVTTNLSGILKGNGTGFTTATSGTDYAPATSGTSILYGNGSGGFSPVTVGSGLTFSGGTLTATGGGGSGTVTSFSAGTLSPLFTTSVATATTTPALSFSLSNAAANTIFGNNASTTGAPAFSSVSSYLDTFGSSQGSLLYRGATGWTVLAPGTSGYVLQTNGAGSNPSWTPVASGAAGANPTASVGLTAVNGSATTFLRSDGAPALSQAITPTWTGLHTFSGGVTIGSLSGLLKGTSGVVSTATAGTDYVIPSGSITGTAGNVTGTVAIANGGTGATTATSARANLLPSYTGQAGNLLAVNGTATDTVWVTPSSTTGATGYWASMYDTTNQSAANTTTAYAMNIGNVAGSGITVGSSNQITFAYTGTYNINYSIQFTNTDTGSGNDNVDIWIRKNGTDVPYSNSIFNIPNAKGGTNGALIATTPYELTVNAGDYIQIMWAVSNTTISIATTGAQSSPTIPVTPGVIVAIQQIANILTNGTVTSVTASGTQGVTTSVATGTTTPAISIGLGNITPTSVSTGALTATGTTTLATSLSGYLSATSGVVSASSTIPTTALSGTITNAQLANSSITFGSTAQALGSTVSALNGVSVGASSASTGAFTTLTSTGSSSFGSTSGSTVGIGINAQPGVNLYVGGTVSATTYPFGLSVSPTLTAGANSGIVYGANILTNIATGTYTGLSFRGLDLGINTTTGTGTFTNSYQLYIESGVSATNHYGIYQVGTDPNYFAGAFTMSTSAKQATNQNLTPATTTVSSTAIDWSQGNSFYKSIAANTTFTFSNAVDGQVITICILQNGGNYTVTWPTMKWSGGTAPTMTATNGKYDVYTIYYNATVGAYFGSYVQNF